MSSNFRQTISSTKTIAAAFAGLLSAGLLALPAMASEPIPYSSEIRFLSADQVAPDPEEVDAKQLLQQMRRDKNPYGEALVLQNLASQAVKNENYGEALNYLEQVVASKGLSGPALAEVQGYMGDLALAADSDAAIIKYLQPELERNNVRDGQLWMRVGYAHYQRGNYRAALPLVKKAQSLEKSPPDQWLQLELVIHQKLGNEKEELALLKKLTGYEPIMMKRAGDVGR